MILKEQMEKLGWSNELIKAVEDISSQIGLRDLPSVESVSDPFIERLSSSSSINVSNSAPVGWTKIPVGLKKAVAK